MAVLRTKPGSMCLPDNNGSQAGNVTGDLHIFKCSTMSSTTFIRRKNVLLK